MKTFSHLKSTYIPLSKLPVLDQRLKHPPSPTSVQFRGTVSWPRGHHATTLPTRSKAISQPVSTNPISTRYRSRFKIKGVSCIEKGKRITFLRKSTVSKSIFIRIKRVLSLEHEQVGQKMPSASMPTREEMQMMGTACSQVTTISHYFSSN